MKKGLVTLLLAVYLVSSSGCGVLLYPERQGQKSGRIDPVVTILDGIGLFFFIIPGLVAFAVDFHQGTIYLPGGVFSDAKDKDRLLNQESTVEVHIDGPVTADSITKAVFEQTGKQIDLQDRSVQVFDISDKYANGIPNTASLRNISPKG